RSPATPNLPPRSGWSESPGRSPCPSSGNRLVRQARDDAQAGGTEPIPQRCISLVDVDTQGIEELVDHRPDEPPLLLRLCLCRAPPVLGPLAQLVERVVDQVVEVFTVDGPSGRQRDERRDEL